MMHADPILRAEIALAERAYRLAVDEIHRTRPRASGTDHMDALARDEAATLAQLHKVLNARLRAAERAYHSRSR
jgi:hypothetical protein